MANAIATATEEMGYWSRAPMTPSRAAVAVQAAARGWLARARFHRDADAASRAVVARARAVAASHRAQAKASLAAEAATSAELARMLRSVVTRRAVVAKTGARRLRQRTVVHRCRAMLLGWARVAAPTRAKRAFAARADVVRRARELKTAESRAFASWRALGVARRARLRAHATARIRFQNRGVSLARETFSRWSDVASVARDATAAATAEALNAHARQLAILEASAAAVLAKRDEVEEKLRLQIASAHARELAAEEALHAARLELSDLSHGALDTPALELDASRVEREGKDAETIGELRDELARMRLQLEEANARANAAEDALATEREDAAALRAAGSDAATASRDSLEFAAKAAEEAKVARGAVSASVALRFKSVVAEARHRTKSESEARSREAILAALRDEFEAQAEELRDANETIAALKIEIATASANAAEARERAREAEANARAREEAISAESAAKDAVADAVRAEKDKEVRAVRAEASEKEFELDSANEIIAGLNRESERSKREWNDARKALDAELRDLRAALDARDAARFDEMRAASGELDAARAEIAALREMVTTASAVEEATKSAAADAFDAKGEAFANVLKALDERETECARVTDALETTRGELDVTREEAERMREAMASSADALATANAAARDALEAKKALEDESRTELAEKDRELLRTQVELEDAHAELSERPAKGALEDAAAKTEALDAEMDAMRATLRATEDELALARDDAAELTRERAAAMEALSAEHAAAMEALSASLRAREEEVETLREARASAVAAATAAFETKMSEKDKEMSEKDKERSDKDAAYERVVADLETARAEMDALAAKHEGETRANAARVLEERDEEQARFDEEARAAEARAASAVTAATKKKDDEIAALRATLEEATVARERAADAARDAAENAHAAELKAKDDELARTRRDWADAVARREAEASAEAAALERDLRAAREASENLITARLAASEAELRATESAAAALDARLAKTTREFERYRQRPVSDAFATRLLLAAAATALFFWTLGWSTSAASRRDMARALAQNAHDAEHCHADYGEVSAALANARADLAAAARTTLAVPFLPSRFVPAIFSLPLHPSTAATFLFAMLCAIARYGKRLFGGVEGEGVVGDVGGGRADLEEVVNLEEVAGWLASPPPTTGRGGAGRSADDSSTVAEEEAEAEDAAPPAVALLRSFTEQVRSQAEKLEEEETPSRSKKKKSFSFLRRSKKEKK